jgi:hypothetical protein
MPVCQVKFILLQTVIADAMAGTPCVFLAGLYRAEQVIAERLLALTKGALAWPSIDPEKALAWIERKTGLALAESQIAAIRLALQSKASGDHRRPGRRQDNDRQLHSTHPVREGDASAALRAHGPSGQTDDRGDRV